MPSISSTPPTILLSDKETVTSENVGGANQRNMVCTSGKLVGKLRRQRTHVWNHSRSGCCRHLLREKESGVVKKYTVYVNTLLRKT